MTIDDSTENWREVPGYQGIYSVSDQGRVRSESRIIVNSVGRSYRHRGRELRPQPHPKGYLVVSLSLDGVVRQALVQHLVAAAFLGPRGAGQVVRHLDDDKTRNELGNLAYGSHTENLYDSVGNGKHHHTMKITCGRGHLLSGENLYFKPDHPQRRQCRSCARAHMWHHYRGLEKTTDSMQTVSDRFYTETIEVAA